MTRFLAVRLSRVVLWTAILTLAAWKSPETRGADKRFVINGITHTYEDEQIAPLAELSANGRHVVLTLGGPAVEVPVGTTLHVEVVVNQEVTGAFAVGQGKGVPAPPDGPETGLFDRTAHATGRLTFVEGPATAAYFAEVRYRGQVVRQWSHFEDVLLLSEEP